MRRILFLACSLATLTFSACKQEEMSSSVPATERVKHGPNEVAVSVNFDALTLEDGADQTGRALSVGLTDADQGARTSYSRIAINHSESMTKEIRAVGVFYAPQAPEGKRVYFTDPNAPMVWKLVEDSATDPNLDAARTNPDARHLRYVCQQSGVVYIDRDVLAAGYDWYFVGVVGAKDEVVNGKRLLSFNPYDDPTAKGYNYQSNFAGEGVARAQRYFDLEIPMTSDWVKVNLYDKVGAPDTEPYFYPANWTLNQGPQASPRIRFRPRGSFFRIRVDNATGCAVRVTGYRLTSNVVAFSANILGQEALDSSGTTPTENTRLALTPIMDTSAQIPIVDNGSIGRRVEKGKTSSEGATLAWGLVNQELLDKQWVDYRAALARQQATGVKAPASAMPYLSVRASSEPAEADMWHSMQKQADFFPLSKRVSYVSQAPVFLARIGENASTTLTDGSQRFFTIRMTSNLSNLELTTFEPIQAQYVLGGTAPAFKTGHPWVNRHADGGIYSLDVVAYPSLAQAKDWARAGGFRSNTGDRDITNDPRTRAQVTSPTTDTAFYVPYKEQFMSYLPIPTNKNGGNFGDSVFVEPGQKTSVFDVDVVENTFNEKKGDAPNKIATAKFVLKGGDVNEVNANYGRNVVTKASLPSWGDNESASQEVMANFNYFNYFWCTHVVYGLAYLREGDPESLVAYRYFWGMSPTPATGLLPNLGNFWPVVDGNNIYLPSSLRAWVTNTGRPAAAPEDILAQIRSFSAFSAGRPTSGGAGRAMTSFFSVAMRHIGQYSPLVQSLEDIDAVAKESFWTEAPEQVTFRHFTAVGYSRINRVGNSAFNFAINRNRGVYLMTQSKPEGGTDEDFYYFYIGPRSWGLYKTTDSETLNEEWRKMHIGQAPTEGIRAGYNRDPELFGKNNTTDTGFPARHSPVYNVDRYRIPMAYPGTGAGIPIRFMVGKDIGTPVK